MKYKPVNLSEKEEGQKKTFLTTSCFWSSVTTSTLIATYFVPSIGLTFYQRWFLKDFHYPLTVIICHLIIKFLLAVCIKYLINLYKPQPKSTIPWKLYVKAVVPTGVASGFDVGCSNWGLVFVTVSLYTMTKSTTIIFILICAILFKLEKKSWSLCAIVLMIAVGLIMFTYDSPQFNATGFMLVLFASFCSGLRWTCAQLLLQKLGLQNPIDMIYHVQPWMLLSIIPFAMAFEGIPAMKNCQFIEFDTWNQAFALTSKILLGAVIAFVMELTEFMVVAYTSSLTLSIAGIFKEMLILVLAVEWNGDQLTTMNLLGLVICLGGVISHIVHKIRSGPTVALPGPRSRYDEFDDWQYKSQSLLEAVQSPSDEVSEEDEIDSEVIFNILHRRSEREKQYS